MAEQGFITNNREQTIVDIRNGGAGNPWEILDSDAEVDAPSGGQQSYELSWGRSPIGTTQYIRQRATGNPSPYTFNLMARLKVQRFMQGLLGNKNERWNDTDTSVSQLDIRVRFRNGDPRDINNFSELINYFDVRNTSDGYSDKLADSKEGVDAEQTETVALQAGFEYRQKPVKHFRIGSTGVVQPQNDLLWVGGNRYVSCGDATATPAGTFAFTINEGGSWTFGEINTHTNGVATSVALSGRYLLFAGGSDGVAYIDKESLLTGASTTFTLASGIATNFPDHLGVCPNGRVWAVGAGGRVWRSDDNGLTFSVASFSASTTTENITSIHAVGDDEVWCGLANGTCLLIRGLEYPTASVVATGNTDQVDAILAGLGGRTDLYLGTDAGTIYKSVERTVSAPVFSAKTFPGTGVGGVRDLQWGSLYGETLWIVTNNASPVGSVMRDLSGGFLTVGQVEIIGGTLGSVTNSGLNAIAPAFNKRGLSDGSGLCIGEVNSATAFVGQLVSE